MRTQQVLSDAAALVDAGAGRLRRPGGQHATPETG